MGNEKLGTTLKMSLETDEAIRQKSEVLRAGYDDQARTWEVIVKYHGDISGLAEVVQAADILLNGYAVMTVTKEQLADIVQSEEIDFVEQPKRMQYSTYRSKQASCILPVTEGRPGLSGKGVLIACIDSGIDYLLRDFQNERGSRILYLWDQTVRDGGQKPEGFSKGTEYTKEDIDKAISAAGPVRGNGGDRMTAYERAQTIVPSRDVTGHGTAVAGIAAGSSVSPLYRGVAPKSDLLIVKLEGNSGRGNAPEEANFPLTTDLMRGITYAVKKAEELGRPVVINLSIGDTYGAHDGTSLLERFIDSVCENGRNVICIGSGNEGGSNGHTSFLPEGEIRVELSVAERERGVNVQLWKNYVDECNLEIEAPDGSRYGVNTGRDGMQMWVVKNTRIFLYISGPKPFSVNEELFFDFLPLEDYIDSGIWTFIIMPVSRSRHDYHMYLPSSNARNATTRFLTPTPELTMTIPGFASRALTVGAYDIVTNNYADFSGRDRNMGEEERNFFAADIKPDIAAPGVNITAPAAGGGYAVYTGTSFATPLVTGGAALLTEWGIIRGNDRFLYGEKVKAYLRKGAKQLGGNTLYPNPKTGWGALCVSDSLPE